MFEEEIIPLSDDAFRLIRDYLSDYCGLYFDEKSKPIFERRLNRRLKLNHLKDFREYYRLLLYDLKREEELQSILDILTVNETYFFRGEAQIAAFRDEILPELKEKNKNTKTLNIWSAPCSTGEEPYTLSMLILEDRGFSGWDINILGSDISQRVISSARRGIYRETSFRVTKEYYLKKYFKNEEGGGSRISDAAKNLVNLNLLNLFDPYKTRLVNPMDVIFCRNLLIYFSQPAREKVVKNLYNALKEGGYLLLGASESLMNITTMFKLKHLKNDIVYQKPERVRKM